MPENSQRRYSSLRGKVALVTGSAKRLGRAVALRLAEEGADLVIHHRASHARRSKPWRRSRNLGGGRWLFLRIC